MTRRSLAGPEVDRLLAVVRRLRQRVILSGGIDLSVGSIVDILNNGLNLFRVDPTTSSL